MNFTRQKSDAFNKFKKFVEKAVSENKELIRFDCLNPVKAITHEFDFSIIPEIDIDFAWKQYLKVYYEYFAYSKGVRESLYNLFELLKTRRFALPADVYPVYQMMADEIGIKYTTYSTLPSYNLADALIDDVALITAPHAPTGKDLNEKDVEVLMSWLLKSKDNLLIIDRVYDYNNSDIIQPLINTNQTIVCYSLSKTFLSPLMMGLTILPNNIKLPSKIENEDQVKVLLTRYKGFPKQQQEIFKYRWNLLRIQMAPLQSGYLSTIPTDHKTLLNFNILAVPGEVYGTTKDISIISCLHETNHFREKEEVERYYVTTLSNFAKGYDKYTRRYSKTNIPQSTYPNQFYLTDRATLHIGIKKANQLLTKTVKGDSPIIIRTKIARHRLNQNTRTGFGEYIDQNWIDVESIFDILSGSPHSVNLNPKSIEDAYAESLNLNELLTWSQIKPRSLSVLPIAQACQAKCAFCFSHSSISDEQKQGRLILSKMKEICMESKKRGANRFVITGGGEPTLLAHEKLLEVMKLGLTHFDKTIMITNGYNLGNANPEERLKTLMDYQNSGLNVLSISRHSHNNNTAIMSLDTKSELIAETWRNNKFNLTLRWVCVLQKAGIHDLPSLVEYLDWVVETGVSEVCFKELYVAATTESEYHNTDYNKWCTDNQVPLKLILDFLEWNCAVKVSELPWGSPVYNLKWKGRNLKVAAYTEPSVFWERTHGICRSWNLMADGNCYANLETIDSMIEFNKMSLTVLKED